MTITESKKVTYDIAVIRGFLIGVFVLSGYVTRQCWGTWIAFIMVPLTVILAYISIRFSLKHPF